jgi:hypothetical protein
MAANFCSLARGLYISPPERRYLRFASTFGLLTGLIAALSAFVYSLALRPSHSSSFKPSPVAEANEEYKMRMNELHANLNVKAAIKHFTRATQLDANYADAFAQLADAWFSIPGEDSKRKGQEAAETAFKIRPALWACAYTQSHRQKSCR